jgi:hypothetical protein
MPAYLVRLIKNRDIVGIFAADDETDLRTVVDECTDIPGCEYAELPPGGIMWESPAVPVPLDSGDPEDDDSEVQPFPWSSASLTERWWNFAYGFEEAEWIPFIVDGPEEPEPAPERRPFGPGLVVPLRGRRGK